MSDVACCVLALGWLPAGALAAILDYRARPEEPAKAAIGRALFGWVALALAISDYFTSLEPRK